MQYEKFWEKFDVIVNEKYKSLRNHASKRAIPIPP